MLTYFMIWLRGDHAQELFISSIKHPLIGIQNIKHTVESATYGSEFVVARTAVDQIIEL